MKEYEGIGRQMGKCLQVRVGLGLCLGLELVLGSAMWSVLPLWFSSLVF